MGSAYVRRRAGKRALRCYSERAACAQTARAPVVFARGRTPAHDASREGSDGTQARRAGRGGQLAGRGHPVRRRHHLQAAPRRAHRRRRVPRHHAARSRPRARCWPATCARCSSAWPARSLRGRWRWRRTSSASCCVLAGGAGLMFLVKGGTVSVLVLADRVGRRGGTPAAAHGRLPPGDAVLDRDASPTGPRGSSGATSCSASS